MSARRRSPQKLRRVGRVRLLFVLDGFEGWEAEAAWNDLGFYVKHGDMVERIAIAGDERWRGHTMMFAGADLRKRPWSSFPTKQPHAPGFPVEATVMNESKHPRRAIAVLTALSLLAQPSAPVIVAQASQAPPAAKPATPSAQTPATTAPPRRRPQLRPRPLPLRRRSMAAGRASTIWPSGGSILVYQPQIASWDKQADMVAFSAVSYRSKAGDKPALGTIKLESDTKVALDDRLVSFRAMKIVEANFQTLPKEQVREIVEQIDKAIPDDDRVIALDRVLANLDKSQIVPKNVEGVKADPPAIFFSKTPAVIVNLDGDPIWSPIKENDLKYAVNTNWDLFEHGPTKTYYLRNDATWLKATDIKGTWSAAGTLPRELQETAGGRQLEGREGESARQAGPKAASQSLRDASSPAS